MRSWSAGDRDAEAQVLPLIYDEPCRTARTGLNGDAGSITMQATDIVNEAYLRLARQRASARPTSVTNYELRCELRRITANYGELR